MKRSVCFLFAMALLTAALCFSSCGECKHEWQEATCTKPKICAICGETDGQPLGHTWQGATCVKPKTCSVCGTTEGSALGHTWVAADCTAPRTCSTCEETEGDALGHTWQDATCTKPKTCSTCGETEGSALGHTWVAADCTAPRTCSTCGETDGQPLGHTWQNATCTKPKTCSTCGETDGNALGHKWQDATCTKPKTCLVCGETEGDVSSRHSFSDTWSHDINAHWHAATCIHTSEIADRAAHTYDKNKTCTVCGYTDVRLAVRIVIDGETVGTLYTDEDKNFLIQAPERPEDITTNPNAEKYFYGWFVDPNFQTPLFDTTEFRKDGAIYGKWVTVYSAGFTYTVSKGEATITGYADAAGAVPTTTLVVPAYVNGFPVRYIGENAFKGNTMLRTVIFCNGITDIGASALEGCNSVTKVELPDSIQSIDIGAFLECACLAEIRIPDGVTTIPAHAFDGCEKLSSVVLSSNTKHVGESAFEGCVRLTNIAFENFAFIGSRAFYGCVSLTDVVLSDNIESIGLGAFANCSGLKSITLPFTGASAEGTTNTHFGYIFGAENYSNNGKYIPDSLKKIVISGKNIGDYAFYRYEGLTDFTISDSIESIGRHAFDGCTGLTAVTVPNSVKKIGLSAFAGCSGLASITLPFTGASADGTSNTHFGYIFGAENYSDNGTYIPNSLKKIVITGTNIGDYAFYHYAGLTDFTISDSIESIGNHAFDGCMGLTSITVPKSIRNVREYAFSGCANLNSFTFADNSQCSSIGDHAFDGCIALKGIIIPGSVLNIGKYAFGECTGLTAITIPSSVKNIGLGAFANCSGLTSITFPFTGTSADSTTDTHFGYIFGAANYSDNGKYIPSNLKTVVLTGGTSIGQQAFSGCSGLTSITIPSSVTNIGEYAFSGCSGLTSVTVPGNVKSIGLGAFANCSGLTTITLPFTGATINGTTNTHFGYIFGAENYSDNGKYIPDSLKKIVISGKNIGDYAFYRYEGLTDFTISDSIESIGRHAFDECTGLTSITIPKSIRSVGEYAFSGCVNLNSFIFADNSQCTSIGKNALSGCSGLTAITIPNSVKNIGLGAFENCSGITTVTLPFTGATINGTTNTHFGYIFGAENYSDNGKYIPGNLKTVVLTGGTSIGQQAFFGCSGLTSVTIASSVTNIGEYAFSSCSGLTSVTIPGNVKSIGLGAFADCSGLKSITLPFVGASADGVSNTHFGYIFGAENYSGNGKYVPNNLKTVVITGGINIGNSAFHGCSKLTSITIPNSITSIGDSAFSWCSGLKEVHISDIAAWCKVSFDSSYANPLSYAHNLYLNDTVITELTIPNSVTSISSCAFYGCSGLTAITIPNSVKNIGLGAFSGCSGLTSITLPFTGASADGTNNTHFGYIFGANNYWNNSSYLPSNLKKVVLTGGTSINNSAFEGCYRLTSITIPGNVTNIGSEAFKGCSGLTSITIPNSVTSIDEDAFYGCTRLTSITIPNSVTSIGNYAFSDCSGLKEEHISDIAAWCKISFGNSGANPLIYAHNLYLNDTLVTELTIPNSVTSIGKYAFDGCSGLTSITIQSGVKSIGNYAFYGCSGLTSVTIQSGVKSIGNYAFAGCTGLTSIIIPSSVTSIGSKAFSDCSGLKEVHISDITAWCKISFGSSDANPLYYVHNLYLNDTLVTKLTIPNGVTSIETYAFSGCSLTSIIIPSSVTSIGRDAFYGCEGLTDITVEKGNSKYHSAGNCVIETKTKTLILGCKNSIIPTDGSVTSIGDYAFSGCKGLTSITIPSSVTSIGSRAFSDCSGLKEVHISDIAAWCKISFSSSAANPLTYAHNLYLNDTLITELTISNSVTSIGNYAFSGCSLTSIIIPSSVTSIGDYAFYGCSLTSIIIPNSVTSIGDYAFSGCKGLTSISIPSSVTRIDDDAFFGCSGLKEVHISDIGAWCKISFKFSASNPLTYAHNLYLNDTLITELIIPNSVTSIGNYAFYGCTGLTSITIPDSVTSIGNAAFHGCTGLTSITIPNSVTSIGNSAFSGCTGLTSITIPNSVTIIDNNTFYGCSGLTSITIPNSVTCIGGYAFYRCGGLTSIIIPSSVTKIYKKAFDGCSKLTSVYYKGTQQQWNELRFGDNNSSLTSATRYYFSENEPAHNSSGTGYDGNYWHYGADGTPVIWKKEN